MSRTLGEQMTKLAKEDWAVIIAPDGTLKGVLMPEDELDLNKVPVEIRMMIKLVYDDDILEDKRTLH